MARIAQTAIDALKARMPDYLERVHNITDLRRQFPVPWRHDEHPSCKYAPKSLTIIDMSRSEAKDVFQLCGSDFGIERFPDQVAKVADILGEQVCEGEEPIRRKRNDGPLFDPPDAAGFDEDVRDACITACRDLLEADYAEPGRKWLQGRGFAESGTWVRYGLGYVGKWKTKCIHRAFSVHAGPAVGFVTFPYFFADRSIRYCALRTVVPQTYGGDKYRKEWCPKGITRPLYNEHYLKSGLDAVAVCEGPIDAISLAVMTGVPTVGLGSTSMVARFCSVLYYAKPEERPGKVILNMDADGTAGPAATAKMASFLDKMKIEHNELAMPSGVKDANAWLVKMKGGS